MTHTITALFDSRGDAEAAGSRLRQIGLGATHVQVHDQSSAGITVEPAEPQSLGLWATIKNAFLPAQDRHTYEEGIRRGGYLLTADVDNDKVDDAVRVLDAANAVDLDERAAAWRTGGWQLPADGEYGTRVAGPGVINAPMESSTRAPIVSAAQPPAATPVPVPVEARLPTAPVATATATATLATAPGSLLGGEQVIPIVEEQLVVGKREVDRGSVRVRSYVTEIPVQDQIRLRNERIHVTRRAVDLPLAADENAFEERLIELTARGEEAVVTKTARVVEEVVVAKTADERVEQIHDTVRRTDVDVVEDAKSGPTPGPRAGA